MVVADERQSFAQSRVLLSRRLFDEADELLIKHAGVTYRLHITQANKLISIK